MRGGGRDRRLARKEVPHVAGAQGLVAHRQGALLTADEGRAVRFELALKVGALPAEIGEALRGELEAVGDLRGGGHESTPVSMS